MNIAAGNTSDGQSPSANFRGWLVGELLEWAKDDPAKQVVAKSNPVLSTAAVGVKFQLEERGKTGPLAADTGQGDGKVTLGLLVSGHMRINLVSRAAGHVSTHHLTSQGDYLAWPSSVYGHSWEALADTILVTVRWPELAPVEAAS